MEWDTRQREDLPARAPEEDGPLPRRIWRLSDLVIGVLVLILSLVAVAALLFLGEGLDGIGTRPEEDVRLGGALLTIAFELVFGLAVLLLAMRRGISLRTLGFREPRRWGLLPLAVIGAYGSIILYQFALGILERMGVDTTGLREGNPIPLTEEDRTITWVLLGFAVIAVAPFAEELFFRALVFRAFTGWWGPAAGFLVSGLAFGLFHFNVSVIVPFTMIGAIFAWVYWASGSLWTPMIAHAIVNGLSFILTFAGVEAG
jgi:membrane protease YdiL (CAAX protease family)